MEKDHQKVMVLGAVWCPKEKTRQANIELRELKQRFGLTRYFEAKWVKVSPAKIDYYLALLDYYFNNADLHFRALIVPDKEKLSHATFGQTHDDWYYKMYFDLLKAIFTPHDAYRVYMDYKDSRGGEKVKNLHDILCNNMYDYSREIIRDVQLVRSHECELMQLTDLFIGAIAYVNRELNTSPAKLQIIKKIQELSGYSLTRTTLLHEDKVNIFRWQARNV
jgi:hypothetical protein